MDLDRTYFGKRRGMRCYELPPRAAIRSQGLEADLQRRGALLTTRSIRTRWTSVDFHGRPWTLGEGRGVFTDRHRPSVFELVPETALAQRSEDRVSRNLLAPAGASLRPIRRTVDLQIDALLLQRGIGRRYKACVECVSITAGAGCTGELRCRRRSSTTSQVLRHR